jgi:hypothetical protein
MHGRGPGKIKRIKPQNTPVHRYCTNLAQGDKSLEKEEIVEFFQFIYVVGFRIQTLINSMERLIIFKLTNQQLKKSLMS